MWRGMLIGTVLGVTAAAALMFGWFVIRYGFSASGWFVRDGSTVVLGTSVIASPGALILSVPMCVFLRRQRRRGRSPGNLLVLAAAVGAGLGLANLLGVLIFIDGFRAVQELFTDPKDGPAMLLAAAAGGLGLGLGCFWGLPRKESA